MGLALHARGAARPLFFQGEGVCPRARVLVVCVGGGFGTTRLPAKRPPSKTLPTSLPLALSQVLVGNKADIPEGERAVSTAAGAALAKECGMAFFEASAKSGEGVDEAFLAAARAVVAAGGGGVTGQEGGLRLGGGGGGGGAGGGGSRPARSACCS